MPPWKFGIFLGYNAAALVGIYFYGVKLRGKRVQPSLKNLKTLSIDKLFVKGVKHGVCSSLCRPLLSGFTWLDSSQFAITQFHSLIFENWHKFRAVIIRSD